MKLKNMSCLFALLLALSPLLAATPVESGLAVGNGINSFNIVKVAGGDTIPTAQTLCYI